MINSSVISILDKDYNFHGEGLGIWKVKKGKMIDSIDFADLLLRKGDFDTLSEMVHSGNEVRVCIHRGLYRRTLKRRYLGILTTVRNRKLDNTLSGSVKLTSTY